jgi:NADH-quinone oxidoreductase subunit L
MLLSEAVANGTFFGLAPLALALPLLGLLANMAFGRRLGERAAGWVASLASGGAFVTAVLLAISLQAHPEGTTVVIAPWFSAGGLELNWAMKIDTLSVTMMLVVSGVGTLIHVYAVEYMRNDVHHNGDPGRYPRFFVFFNLFILAMLVLVSADSYLTMFVGWEGVGLCSYLLIGFWFEKGQDGIGNALAGKKAFVVNRIGDFGVLIAMFLLFWQFHTLSFDGIFSQLQQANLAALPTLAAFFLLMGVAGKSAQLPLYVWLPDAMAGPTPVSALIHAATMVTAGIYLVARSAPIYHLVPAAGELLAWVGAATALFAALIAIGQFDIKKVLAYSTISQLGYMAAAVGMGAYTAGLFHLVTHAFFKALLFLGAGSVIQGLERGAGQGHGEHLDPQDMRAMGGLRRRMPLTFWTFLIGALALAGIAPLAGFFSKDEILAFAAGHSPGALILLIVAAFLTAFYMGRQVCMVFFGAPRSLAAEHADESRPVMTVPLVILAAGAALGGLLNAPGRPALEAWLEHTFGRGEAGGFVLPLAATVLALALIAGGLAWRVYRRLPDGFGADDPLRRMLGPVFVAFERKFWVDELYGWLIVHPYQALAGFLAKPVDAGVIDGIAAGLANGTRVLAGYLRRLQNGFVRAYALFVLAGVVVMLAYLITR